MPLTSAKASPAKDMVDVPVDQVDQSRFLKNRSQLRSSLKESSIAFLRANLDVFA